MAVKMRGVLAGCALSVVLLAAAWAEQPHQHRGEMTCHKLSSPNADFAFALYKSLNAKAAAGKNIIFSPLGISTILSMMSTGARGETHRQLFSTLGYSDLDQTQVNEAYKHLFDMHGHTEGNQQLDVGNGVALDSSFVPLETFVKDVKQYYSGEIFNVDFSKPAEAAAEINSFIANKTHDLIKDIVTDLSSDMAMVLLNYVYFRGQWKNPFNSDVTHKADFHVDKTTKVQMDMMKRTGDYKSYWDAENHTTVVMLPYKGNTSMMIVLPDEGKMSEVEGFMSKEHLKHWLHSVSITYVDLFLPKFSTSADASLDDTLKEMGITKAFEKNADFSGISHNLKLSKASHKTVLSVTERGTEAASISIMEFIFTSLPPTIRINRPFLVFILENSSESILFMGKINNPAAN